MSSPASAPERILQRLDWHVIRRLDGLLQGDYRTLFYGQGVDLADLREYQPGDDVRYIDWNVTARMDAPYVRQYTEDREITAWFLLDLSPSVDFGTADAERQKRTVLIDFVTTLARLLTRHGNRVGAVFYGNRPDWIPNFQAYLLGQKDLDAYIKDEQAEMLASTQKTIREAKLDIPCGQ